MKKSLFEEALCEKRKLLSCVDVTRTVISEADQQLKKVVDAPKQKISKQLQKFLGVMVFICKRIPYINIAFKELYALVGKCQNRPFRWEEKHKVSFERGHIR